MPETARKEQAESPKAGKALGHRFKVIAENTGLFFFSFELGYNRCLKKFQEHFQDVDTNFLTLIDFDDDSLMEDIMGGDPACFVITGSTVLDEAGRIADEDFRVEHDPQVRRTSSGPRDKGRSRRPPRATRGTRGK